MRIEERFGGEEIDIFLGKSRHFGFVVNTFKLHHFSAASAECIKLLKMYYSPEEELT